MLNMFKQKFVSFLSEFQRKNFIFSYKYFIQVRTCHFVLRYFVIFVTASRFHPPRTRHLSGRWTGLSSFCRLPENWSSSDEKNFLGIEKRSKLKVRDAARSRWTYQLNCNNVPISPGLQLRREISRCPDGRQHPSILSGSGQFSSTLAFYRFS